MPKIDVLLHGFRFNTDAGIPGFCSVLLIEGTKRTLVDVGTWGGGLCWRTPSRSGASRLRT